MQKPDDITLSNAKTFQDAEVVAAYRHRPLYPDATFDILVGLIAQGPRRILDVGCGTGNIARPIMKYVDHVDAVDFSQAMIEAGQQLPLGDHPHLRWRHGRVEDVVLDPPYSLVTAGGSLHWMDQTVVLPRFRELLVPNGYLALVSPKVTPHRWETLDEILTRYRMDGGFKPYDMVRDLEDHGLFQKIGEAQTDPIEFRQTVNDYIEAYHAYSGFARTRMGEEQAAAFDREARQILLNDYPDGIITLQVAGTVLWGLPG